MNHAHAVYNIQAHQPFAEVLARELLRRYNDSPEDLSRAVVFLPSRRAIRHLQDAFLRVSEGRALLLPQMQALGDIEEKFLLRHAMISPEVMAQLQSMPREIQPLERLLIFSQLVHRYGNRAHHSFMRWDQALQLAQELEDWLDEMQRERALMCGFNSLVPQDFAEYWQETLEFLNIICEAWPRILQEKSATDPWVRRNHYLTLLAQSWQQNPPNFPVIAAGTTGSIPAVAELLKVITTLPQGQVVLPALDIQLPNDSFAILEESHPQYGMRHLLEKMAIGRESVISLPADASSPTVRETWLSLALQPAETTELWRHVSIDTTGALKDCRYLICKDQRHEAVTISLILREALETPAKTAALVTADRDLARQVAAQLNRWGIVIDDSAGMPMNLTPAGNMMLLLLQCVQNRNAPVSLLSLLKHPLVRLGREAGAIRPLVREMEQKYLRGLKPNHLAEIIAKTESTPALDALLRNFERAVEPLAQYETSSRPVALSEMIAVWKNVAEALSGDTAGSPLLFVNEAGRQLAVLLEELVVASDTLAMNYHDFVGFAEQLLRQHSFRSVWNRHPRLQILSPMEARMLSGDCVVLGGMNEGSWPQKTEAETWINRQMRKALGLPAPERQIGLLAHDFATLAAMPEVYFTRAEKIGGTATVPSRFLQRMEVVLKLVGGDVSLWKNAPQQQWALQIDDPVEQEKPLMAPAPRPPLEARPRRLSVTQMEKLMRDPYSIYAQKILMLEPLDPLQQVPDAREFGEAAHKALENFVHNGGLKAPQPLTALLQEGEKVFSAFGDAFMIEALWKPRFASVAQWVLEQDWPEHSLCEVDGKMIITTSRGEFMLTARVDRLDVRPEGINLIDYKTGTPPSKTDIALGLGCQLVLSAMIVQSGGFGEKFQHRPVIDISYWKLSGGSKGGEIQSVEIKNRSLQSLIDEAAAALPKLLSNFDNVTTPYLSTPDLRSKLRYNNYEHLARIAEWSQS